MTRGWHDRRERQRSHLAATAPALCWVRPVLGDHRLVGKSPEGSRQPGGRLELQPASAGPACSRPYLVVDLRFVRTPSDRWRPSHSPGCRPGVYLACTTPEHGRENHPAHASRTTQAAPLPTRSPTHSAAKVYKPRQAVARVCLPLQAAFGQALEAAFAILSLWRGRCLGFARAPVNP
jgi:hypothetical protein